MNLLIKFLGGRSGEEQRILRMLGMGFFMGCFLATLQVPAETLITLLGADSLDTAFFLSGALGVVSAGVYVWAQRYVRFGILAIVNISIILLVVVGLRFAFYDYPLREVSFSLFVLLGPLTSITLLTFWGIFGRIFDLRASKRIIGGIDTGQLTATCAAFFAVSFVSDYIHTVDLLWISAAGCLLFFLMVVFVCSTDPLDKQDVERGALALSGVESKRKSGGSRVTYLSLIKNKYFLLLSVFLMCSVSLSKLNEYSYRSVMWIYAGGDEAALNSTYALIDAIIIVISFLIQSFLNDFIIGRFGLKISLMAMPVILALFTGGAIVAGHLFVYESAAPGFFVFFSFNVMGRILTASLRDALESPAFKMFFFPINAKDRFDVQSRVEGVVKEMASLLVGGGLILLSGLAFFDLIQASYLVIGVVFLTMIAVIRLYAQYKNALKDSLISQKRLLQDKMKTETKTALGLLAMEIQRGSLETILFSMRMFEYIAPMQVRQVLVETLGSSYARVRRYAYKALQRLDVFEHLEHIKSYAAKEKDDSARNIAITTIQHLQSLADNTSGLAELQSQARSSNPKDRLRAARLFTKHRQPECVPMLLELANDANKSVTQAALLSAGYVASQDYWSMLFSKLHDPVHGSAAMSAIVACKQKIEQNVDLLFYRTNQHFVTMYRVIQTLATLATPSSMERIWKKLDYPNHKIFHVCIQSLHANNYRASAFKASRIRLYIDHLIEDIAWNVYAIENLKANHPVDKLLREAIEEENRANKSDLFMALAMVYDAESIRLVKENIDFGTPESLTYAIELLNTFLEDVLKPKLFPLFDDLLPAERLSRLSDYFAPERFRNHEDVLLQIINRDYNHISRWCKALALYRLSSLDTATITRDLVANIYNPDVLLLETTAFTLLKKDRQRYQKHTLEIPPRLRKQLNLKLLPPTDRVADTTWERPLLLVERTLLLKQVKWFKDISSTLLAEISDASSQESIEAGTHFVKQGSACVDQPLRVIISGEVIVRQEEVDRGKLGRLRVIGMELFNESGTYLSDYYAHSQLNVLSINMRVFLDLISQHISFVEALLQQVRIDAAKRTSVPVEVAVS